MASTTSDETTVHEHDDHHGPVHIAPNSMYFLVFAALAVLTVLTWWVALYDFGVFNDFIALGIAVTKASLVVAFFMHVKFAGKLTQMVVAAAVIWVSIMFSMTLMDYLSRNREAVVPDIEPVPSRIVIEGEGEHGSTAAEAESH